MGRDEKHEKALVSERLTALWRRELPKLPLAGARYALISDTHMGDGKGADDFRRNEAALVAALDRYRDDGYALVLLGDVEELWQFDMAEISGRYGTSIYERMRSFGDERLHRVFGNHDLEWGSPVDPALPGPPRTHGVPEGLKLTDGSGRSRALLVHGHQGTHLSDFKSWSSRFWVRVVRKFEPLIRKLGLWRNPSIPKSPVTKDFERTRYAWAKQQGVLLICGHSHRAVFASVPYSERLRREQAELQKRLRANRDDPDADRWRRELDHVDTRLRDERDRRRDIAALDDEPVPCYFNTGCGLYTGGVTAIEIDGDEIRLVKWHNEEEHSEHREVLQAARMRDVLGRV